MKNLAQNRISVILIASILILLGANLMVSNILSTTGSKLRSLQQRKENLLHQNDKIQNQIINRSSLMQIEVKAYEIGLVKTKNLIYVSEDLPVAMRHQ